MDLTTKIIRVQQSTQIDQQGNPQHFVTVQFTLGDHGPFSITVPSAQFQAPLINQRIEQIKQTIAQIGV